MVYYLTWDGLDWEGWSNARVEAGAFRGRAVGKRRAEACLDRGIPAGGGPRTHRGSPQTIRTSSHGCGASTRRLELGRQQASSWGLGKASGARVGWVSERCSGRVEQRRRVRRPFGCPWHFRRSMQADRAPDRADCVHASTLHSHHALLLALSPASLPRPSRHPTPPAHSCTPYHHLPPAFCARLQSCQRSRYRHSRQACSCFQTISLPYRREARSTRARCHACSPQPPTEF